MEGTGRAKADGNPVVPTHCLCTAYTHLSVASIHGALY